MAEFDEKLNSILSNQDAMAKIMDLARSLSGGEAAHSDEDADAPGEETTDVCEPPAQDLSAMMGQIDPNMIRLGMEIIQKVRETEDRNAALLAALRPFLRDERRGKLDRAMQIARMTRMIRVALTTLGERGTGEDV